MIDSALVTVKTPATSGTYTIGRNGKKISEITIHHMAGFLDVDKVVAMWKAGNRATSSNYGVKGKNIGQYVGEENASWCNGNFDSNCRAVTIETANSSGDPNWPVSDETLATLIKLVADIAKRNNLGELVVGKNLTYHSMYAATGCPGPYLFNKLGYIADEANKINATSSGAKKLTKGYSVQFGFYANKANADSEVKRFKDAGLTCIAAEAERYI